MLLEGIFLPLTTPFYPDGRVYLRKLEANVEHYSRTPVAGMLVLGDAGEADGLTDAEARAVLEAAIAFAGVEKVMVAGVSRGSVVATLELAGVAAAAGYDAVAVGTPLCVADLQAFAPERLTYFGLSRTRLRCRWSCWVRGLGWRSWLRLRGIRM